MPLHDPVAVFTAANNVEASFVRDALAAAGIEAFVIEDVSQIGTWWGGLIPEIHKPQIWVERDDAARARPVLEEYERRAAARHGVGAAADDERPFVEAVCEECGGRSLFPPGKQGSVQECPRCGAYLDVGTDEVLDVELEEDEAPES